MQIFLSLDDISTYSCTCNRAIALCTVFWPDRYFERARLKQLQLANAADRSNENSNFESAACFFLYSGYPRSELFIWQPPFLPRSLTNERQDESFPPRDRFYKENETKNFPSTLKIHRILPFSRFRARQKVRRGTSARMLPEAEKASACVPRNERARDSSFVCRRKGAPPKCVPRAVASPREKVKVIFRQSHYTFAFES